MRADVSRVPPQVLEVRAKKRTGVHSLVTALRNALHTRYPDKSLALGGTFVIQKGKAKIHIMVSVKAFRDSCQHQSPSKPGPFVLWSSAERVLNLPAKHQR